MIMHSIVNREPEYWFDDICVRWGKVERELWALEHLAQQPVEGEKLCHYALDCDYEPSEPNCGPCDYYYAAPGTALGNKL